MAPARPPEPATAARRPSRASRVAIRRRSASVSASSTSSAPRRGEPAQVARASRARGRRCAAGGLRAAGGRRPTRRRRGSCGPAPGRRAPAAGERRQARRGTRPAPPPRCRAASSRSSCRDPPAVPRRPASARRAACTTARTRRAASRGATWRDAVSMTTTSLAPARLPRGRGRAPAATPPATARHTCASRAPRTAQRYRARRSSHRR